MSFAAVEYLPLVALVFGAYALAPARARVGLLLLASWLFYLWVEPRDGVWLALSTLVGFTTTLRLHASKGERARRAWLMASVVFNLGLLATFKYSGFVLTNLGRLSVALGGPEFAFDGFALPLGISFFTFQTLSYTFDVHRRQLAPCRDFVAFALYVSFFPQLVAGPIERGRQLLPQLSALAAPRSADFAPAARRIVIGLAKKWLIADRLYAQVWPVFSGPEGRDSLTLVAAAFGMWVMLYLDFSAYTDLARGSARLFGVELVGNFDRPFLATSIRDWAGRWHTSLSSWMFDYLWGPLSRGKLTHSKVWRSNLVVMGLFGLWHGASWTFVLWGLGYGALISCEHSFRLWRTRRGPKTPSASAFFAPARTAFAWAVTTLIGLVFIALFFSPSLAFFARFQALMWTAGLPTELAQWRWIGLLAGLFAALLAVHVIGAERGLALATDRMPRWAAFAVIALVAASCVLWREGEARPFVYFDF